MELTEDEKLKVFRLKGHLYFASGALALNDRTKVRESLNEAIQLMKELFKECETPIEKDLKL